MTMMTTKKPNTDQEWIQFYKGYKDSESEEGSGFGYLSRETQLEIFAKSLYSMAVGRNEYGSSTWRNNHTMLVALSTFFRSKLIGYGSFATVFDSPFNDIYEKDRQAVITFVHESEKQAYFRKIYYETIGLEAVVYCMTDLNNPPTHMLDYDFESDKITFVSNNFDHHYYVWIVEKVYPVERDHHKVIAGKLLWDLAHLSNEYRGERPHLVDLAGKSSLYGEVRAVTLLNQFLGDYSLQGAYSDIQAAEIKLTHDNRFVILDPIFLNDENSKDFGWSSVGEETSGYKDHWLTRYHMISTPSLLGYFEGIAYDADSD